MATEAYRHATLILVGHGSQTNSESCQTVYQHAKALRDRRIFAEVREGFVRQEPFVDKVLNEMNGAVVFIVPFFISEGYLTEQVLPKVLGLQANDQSNFSRVQQRNGKTIHYCSPVGTHPSMTNVLLSRARDIVARYPFPQAPKPQETALLIAGHGTLKDTNSRRSIDRQVEVIRAMDQYAEVHPVFLEEEPRIADCWQLVKSRNIVLVPLFISDGLHVLEDIPVLLGESEKTVRNRLQRKLPPWRNPTERYGKRLWYASAIGKDSGLTEVILEQVRQADSKFTEQ